MKLFLAALGILLASILLGSPTVWDKAARHAFAQPSVVHANFTLALTPQQFYGRMMSKSSIHRFFPLASPPVDGPESFGAGAITLPIFPIGYYILYDLKWEYAGSVFTSAPATFKYKACVALRRNVQKAAASERCLATMSETVDLTPDASGTSVVVRRAAADITPTIPAAGLAAVVMSWGGMRLLHSVALPRHWNASKVAAGSS